VVARNDSPVGDQDWEALMGKSCGVEGVCDRCDENYPTPWFAPNFLWNIVVGGPGYRGDPGGMLCPNCFIEKAEERGVRAIWKVSAE